MKFVLLSLIICLFSLPALAQMSVEGISISADNSEFDNQNSKIILEGNVQIIFKGHYLYCNRAVIHRNRKVISATGDVIMQTRNTYAEADRIEYNYETEKGNFYQAYIQSGQVVFTGEVIEKVGDINYIATKAQYTACTTCPPAWSFTGSIIEAELGGYAEIKNPLLRVANFPIFYLPKILVPLKSDRQSGFLVPTLEFSGNGGITFSASYFSALSKSTDMTYTVKKYETRGWKGLVEYRYMLSKDSYGELNGGYIYDLAFRDSVDDSTESAIHKSRGYLDYEHYFKLPENYTQRADFTYISDLRYPRDFSNEIETHGKSYIENKLSITKTEYNHFFSAEVGFNRNMLKYSGFGDDLHDSLADYDDAVHRFPEINYSFMEQRLFNSNLLFRLDAQYVNFARKNYAYDDVCDPSQAVTTASDYCDGESITDFEGDSPGLQPDSERDGQFDYGTDLIRTGQRLDLKPTLTYPIQLGTIFNLVPSISYRDTSYKFNPLSTDSNYENFATRRFLQTDISLTTLFGRIYDQDENSTSIFKHEIEPEISYSNRPWVKRPNHEFFGDFEDQPYSRSNEKLTDNDFQDDDPFDNTTDGINKVQFDYRDRVFNKRLGTFSFTNRLIRKRWVGNNVEYQKVASLKLSQSYDFIEAESLNKPHPWSNIDSLLTLHFDNFNLHSAVSYYPYARVSNSSTRIKVFNKPKTTYVQLGYIRSFTINEDNEYDFNERTEVVKAGLGLGGNYISLAGDLDYSVVTNNVQGWRYALKIIPPGNCWGIEFIHWQEIGADVNYKFNFNFNFGGNNS